jgi:hypothetical protein
MLLWNAVEAEKLHQKEGATCARQRKNMMLGLQAEKVKHSICTTAFVISFVLSD